MNTTTSTKAYYLIDCESGVREEVAGDIDAAVARAHEWATEGDYGEVTSTVWVDVAVYEVEDGYEDTCIKTVTAEVDPDEPGCEDGLNHDWRAPYALVGGVKENPGVRGHGGGVISTEVCVCCGCERVVDTWAQRPDNGVQGLTSTEYREGARSLQEITDAIRSDKWVGVEGARDGVEVAEAWGHTYLRVDGRAQAVYLNTDQAVDVACDDYRDDQS